MLESAAALLSDPALAFPVVLTLKACAASLICFALIAVPLALYTARRNGPASRVILFLSTLPLIFPPVALGYLLLVVLGVNGPLGGFLYSHWGVRIIFSEESVMLAAFIAALPLVVRPLKIAFESRELRDLEAAAWVCGASKLRTFLLVTLPTVRNAILSAFLLGVARASGEVGITMMLGGNVAGRTNTLSLEIFNAVGRGDFDAASILCALLAALALVLYVLLEAVRRDAPL